MGSNEIKNRDKIRLYSLEILKNFQFVPDCGHNACFFDIASMSD